MKAPIINIDSFWLPRQSSTLAREVDSAFYIAYGVGIMFFVLIVGGMVYLAYKYRRRSASDVTDGPTHNTRLEVIWTVIPTIIVLAMFFVGLTGYVSAAVAPG